MYKALKVSLLLLASTVAVLAASPNSVEPDKALQMLLEGNKRYMSGQNTHLKRSKDGPAELNASQSPFASIISCADSRVDPLLAFDAGWGELFITRVAGNLSEPYVVGSNEFGYAALGSRLIVVLGHERCGAVEAALGSSTPEGALGKVWSSSAPASGDTGPISSMRRPRPSALRDGPGDRAEPASQEGGTGRQSQNHGRGLHARDG